MNSEIEKADDADLDKKWFDFTIKFVKKLSANGEDWNALSEQEQELVALWKLEADMYNGGFIQFFCNWGITCYHHTIRCLTRLNVCVPRSRIVGELFRIDTVSHQRRLTVWKDFQKVVI